MRALGERRILIHPAMARRAARGRHTIVWAAVRVLTAAAFAVDAYVHATSASIYDPPHGGLITEGNLFRGEAAVASLVALAVLLRPARRVWRLALVVAVSALGAVLLYRFVNVGAIGPIPNLYEPTWQVPGKVTSAYAEGGAVILAAIGAKRSSRPALRPASRTGRARLPPRRANGSRSGDH